MEKMRDWTCDGDGGEGLERKTLRAGVRVSMIYLEEIEESGWGRWHVRVDAIAC